MAMTLCAIAMPYVPSAYARIVAWWHPPKNLGTLFLIVTPSGGRLEGTLLNEPEERLGAVVGADASAP
jgi:hypothetical protein